LEIKDLTKIAQEPDLWNNPEKAKKITQEIEKLKSIVEPIKNLQKNINDLEELLPLIEEDKSLEEEFLNELKNIQNKYEELEFLQLFQDEDDKGNCYLQIKPGAGGTESCDWASMLYRMYQRWAEKKGFKYEIIDYQPGDEAGIKNVIMRIIGPYAYGYLKTERGIHRLVRISPFDANKRRHTSFAAVSVTPEIDETIEVEINEKDLRIDTYRASGAGGQHVNTTDSAVRITHIPTGIVVQCQNERSQIRNKQTAMKLLRSKLYQYYKEKKEEELSKKSGEKKSISWGNQIRSYVFHPYNMVKDHRTNIETGNVQAVMDGDIDQFILGYLKYLLKNKKS